MADKVIFLTTTGAGNWTVPSDFSSTNTIEVIGGGGGGAAGPSGAGGNGAITGSGVTGGDGGAANGGSPAGGAGSTSSAPGSAGTAAALWTATAGGTAGAGSGGGGGNWSVANVHGGPGGQYGGGGGGSCGANGGAGQQGIIVITYTPAAAGGGTVYRGGMLIGIGIFIGGVSVVSTGGNPSGFSISKTSAQTQTYYNMIKAPFASKWAGYQGQTFARDNVVTSNAAFDTEYAACKAAAANNTWFRIRVRTGVTAMYTDDADFRPRNGGGLLIEPDSGYENMQITDAVGGANGRGVQVGRIGHGFHFCKASAGGYQDQIRVNQPATSVSGVYIFQGNRLGLNFAGLGYTENSAALASAVVFTMRFFGVEEVQILDNVFNGFDNGIDVFSCRLVEIARNDFQQFTEDCIGYSQFVGSYEQKGRFADDHSYVWVHHNTARNLHDYYQYTPASSGPHVDFQQKRTTTGYPLTNGAGDPATPTAVNLDTWCVNAGNYYKCIQAGTTGGGTPPTGTGASIVDGSVLWQYMGSVATGSAGYLISESNVVLAASSDYKDQTGVRYAQSIQFHINSDSSRSGQVIVNNIQATRSKYGFHSGGPNMEFARAEYNTFGPTCEIPPSGGMTVADNPTIFSHDGLFPAGAFYARRNICSAITPAEVTSVENITINALSGAAVGTRPGDKLAGTFVQNADGYWRMSYTDDGSVSAAQFVQDMYARLKMADGSDYGAVF
jgi:hypothetical protein